MAFSGLNSESQAQALLLGNPEIYNLPPPASYNGAGITYLASDIIGGIIVHNTGGAGVTATLPTAALMSAALKAICGPQLQIGGTIGCLIINGGASGSITLALGSGGSFDTNQNVASQVVPTANSKYVMVRMTNLTVGSEAYVIYS